MSSLTATETNPKCLVCNQFSRKPPDMWIFDYIIWLNLLLGYLITLGPLTLKRRGISLHWTDTYFRYGFAFLACLSHCQYLMAFRCWKPSECFSSQHRILHNISWDRGARFTIKERKCCAHYHGIHCSCHIPHFQEGAIHWSYGTIFFSVFPSSLPLSLSLSSSLPPSFLPFLYLIEV